MRGKKLWAVALCICLLVFVTLPAMAADPQVTAKDLKGISPKHYKYLFSVVGGAAIGAGVGALLGSGNDVTKGIMVGGGAASAYYLHTHRNDTLHGWRNWAYLGSYTSLSGGAGWTLCGCDDGLVAGSLIGGGATAIWLSNHPQGPATTASNTGSNP